MIKPKSLPLAIGLNLVLPGLGYLYMGRYIVGVIGGALVILMILTAPAFAIHVWLVVNILMALDMWMLHNKRAKLIAEQETKVCPACAERIKIDATKCRFCGEELASPQ